MMHYTTYGYRVQILQQTPGPLWIFLPGGPGLGSSYLQALCEQLQLPGTVLLVDFPKDGTNPEGELGLHQWQYGLIDLLKHYPNAILVTHSFAGMFALSLPVIENFLAGLVLMNTTTANTFFTHVNAMREKHQLPDLVEGAAAYHLNPSTDTYRAFWDTYKFYCFIPAELAAGEAMMSSFAFNSESYHFAIQDFYPDYHCLWQPTQIPLLTIASEQDYICPPTIFMDDTRFRLPNAMHRMIPNAGHCPWLLQINAVRICFTELLNDITY